MTEANRGRQLVPTGRLLNEVCAHPTVRAVDRLRDRFRPDLPKKKKNARLKVLIGWRQLLTAVPRSTSVPELARRVYLLAVGDRVYLVNLSTSLVRGQDHDLEHLDSFGAPSRARWLGEETPGGSRCRSCIDTSHVLRSTEL